MANLIVDGVIGIVVGVPLMWLAFSFVGLAFSFVGACIVWFNGEMRESLKKQGVMTFWGAFKRMLP